VPILAVITGRDPTGKQVHLHGKPHHMTECPAKEPPDWLQWLQQKEFNLLKPTGYVMHHQFNIQQLYALSTLHLCVLYLSENKQWLVPLTA